MRGTEPVSRRNMTRRNYWLIAVVTPLLIVAGDVVYWRITVERLRTGYRDWISTSVDQGWEISSGVVSIGGWPWAATVAIPEFTLRHAGSALPGNLQVAAVGVTLSISMFRPANLLISMSGPVHLRAADTPDLVLTSEEDWVSVSLVDGDSRTINLHATGLRVEPEMAAWHATAGLVNAQAKVVDEVKTPRSEPAAYFSVNAEAIVLPTLLKWPLGTNISSLSLDGVLNGPLPETRDVTGWAEAWRDAGGSLAINHLALGWGPLGLTSSATLALDDQLQPMGSGNGRIVGYALTLDRLAAAGTLTKSAATAAKAMLSLMAGPGGSDEPSAVDVPLTLQYRTLSMRQVPLVRLPELDWPPR
jgi:Uncharacterized protein conserved in bacteria (DUF2125)